MADSNIKRGKVSFQTQGRLLQELGERLMAKADVAILELIKNAYDADATECIVKYDGKCIEIIDNGHGMSEQEFIKNWMHIATPDKQRKHQSKLFKRTVTGSKGIGRFAVRFLGKYLHLETVANSTDNDDGRTLLSIAFDWSFLDSASKLNTVKIPYEVKRAPSSKVNGTKLTIEKLRNPKDINFSDKKFRTELLSIINPYTGLDWEGSERRGISDQDPGFNVILPEKEGEGEEDLSREILNNAYAILTIKYEKGRAKYSIRHKDKRLLLKKEFEFRGHISRGFFADIRYYPRRAGMFKNTLVDGRVAWGWLRYNGGIGIVDHGFRIRPYGFEDNDWLNLSFDSAHNRRDWRTKLMEKYFPMSAKARTKPKDNPMLYLPNFHQLIGAVFVESAQDITSERPTDLTPSMDREGFVDNEAFRELFELVRAGLEMLAYADHKEQRRLQAELRKKEAQALRIDLREAAAYIQTLPGLSIEDREGLVDQFTRFSKQLDDVEEYYQISTSKLEIMGLLGVMAGFVTHEMELVLNGLDRLLEKLRLKTKGDIDLSNLISEIEQTQSTIVEQLDYSTAFIDSVHRAQDNLLPIQAKGAARLVVHRFRKFIEDRRISIDIEIDEGIMTPPLPRALYNGIVMNLFTNALKASIGGKEANPDPRVAIKSWNDNKRHILEVADTGIGIPPSLRKRIWDPMFTTTSSQDYNPLGSGMGLGLTLIKRLLSDIKGNIRLVEPPPGFNTCFRVELLRTRSNQ